MQQLDTTIEQLCFLCGPCRDVISKGHGQLIGSYVRESVKERTWARGRGIAVVGAVIRKRLVTD
jgi:hypothetical protein